MRKLDNPAARSTQRKIRSPPDARDVIVRGTSSLTEAAAAGLTATAMATPSLAGCRGRAGRGRVSVGEMHTVQLDLLASADGARRLSRLSRADTVSRGSAVSGQEPKPHSLVVRKP